MILTTPTKHCCTATKYNHKSYIFTLYLFMLLCVVGNCLLFYCSCTGNCENCCGINGNESVSGGSTSGSVSWSEIEFGNKDNKNNDIKNNKVDGNNILNRAFINGEYKALVDVSIYRGSTGKDYNGAKNEFLKSINNR